MVGSFSKLPWADRAHIDEPKITDYLLNAAHPDNGGKAKFFESQGFSTVAPSRLVAALQGVAVTGDVIQEKRSPYGTKYIVEDTWTRRAVPLER